MAGIKIKLAVDRSRDRVLFADAGTDFVDVLLSFLTLPLSAVHFCVGSSSPGCLSSLHESVSQLRESNLLKGDACHGMLLRPYINEGLTSQQGHSSDCKCWKVMARVELVYNNATTRNMFGKEKQRFVIGDDLVIKPASTVSTVSILQKVGSAGSIRGLEEVEVCVGWEEVVSMLKACISSGDVLTKTFLSKETNPAPRAINNQIIAVPKIVGRYDKDHHDSSPHLSIKIFYDRHKRRVLYAECKHDFVDLLLSFLTYPVGSLFKNLAGTSHLGCSLDNLYSSAVGLDVAGLLTGRPYTQKWLLDPSISPFYYTYSSKTVVEQTIPEWFYMGRIPCTCSGVITVNNRCSSCDPQLSKDNAYVVDDDLLIHQASAILVMKYWCKVQDKDNVLEMDVAISKQEAVDLLRAALTSKTALTDVFMSRLEEGCQVP